MRPSSDAQGSARRSPSRSTSSNVKVLDEALIVDTAAELVDEEGVDALTLSAVAKRLGVTQSALYRHIDGADDLIRRLALCARERLVSAVRDAAVGQANRDALWAVAVAWRRFVREHPGLYAATDRSPLAGDSENEAAVEQIVTVIARVIQGFGLDQGEARQAAWAVRSALHGFVSLESTSGNPESLELDEGFNGMTLLLATGLDRWKDLGER